MKKPNYTPGPWFVNGPFDDESDLFIRAHIDGDSYDIANTGCDETGQAAANAQLISAVTDIFEALQVAVTVMRDNNIDEELSGEFEQFTDALTKAGWEDV